MGDGRKARPGEACRGCGDGRNGFYAAPSQESGSEEEGCPECASPEEGVGNRSSDEEESGDASPRQDGAVTRASEPAQSGRTQGPSLEEEAYSLSTKQGQTRRV